MGTIIPVLTRRSVNFDAGFSLVPMVTFVPTLRWRHGMLVARLHTTGITGSSTLTILVQTTAPSVEDPAVDFVTKTAVAQAEFTASDTAPALLTDEFSVDFGSAVAIYVEGDPNSGDANGVISADLVLKD